MDATGRAARDLGKCSFYKLCLFLWIHIFLPPPMSLCVCLGFVGQSAGKFNRSAFCSMIAAALQITLLSIALRCVLSLSQFSHKLNKLWRVFKCVSLCFYWPCLLARHQGVQQVSRACWFYSNNSCILKSVCCCASWPERERSVGVNHLTSQGLDVTQSGSCPPLWLCQVACQCDLAFGYVQLYPHEWRLCIVVCMMEVVLSRIHIVKI